MRFRCPECNRMVTRGPSGVEYGHYRGVNRPGEEDCPRRPAAVDPKPDQAAGRRGGA